MAIGGAAFASKVAGSAIDFETLFKETTMKKYLDYWELWRAKASNS